MLASNLAITGAATTVVRNDLQPNIIVVTNEDGKITSSDLNVNDIPGVITGGATSITVDDLTGGTFTISNGGVFGSMLSTPIINPPQSGILGMHNIVERPVAVDGKVVIRPIMYVALSYDHRIIDGKESVGFLVAVKEALENPVELLMDGNETKALEL